MSMLLQKQNEQVTGVKLCVEVVALFTITQCWEKIWEPEGIETRDKSKNG